MKESSAPERPKKLDGLDVNDVDDGLVVYNESSDRVHYVNHTASLVYELCSGETSIDEIAVLLQRTWDLDSPPIEETRACVVQLVAEGLVR